MSEDAPKRDYAVGRGKPPAHTRFKPGQSGNPKGRPRGVPNLHTALPAALAERVSVVENGRRAKISKLELLLTQMTNKAVKGDVRAAEFVLRLMQRVGLADPPSADRDNSDSEIGSAEEQELFASILNRLTKGTSS